MTTILDAAFVGNSVPFYVKTYAVDGVTAATPTDTKCSVWPASDPTTPVVDNQDGSEGSGFAQYVWQTVGVDPGVYKAVLTVTLPGSVVQAEEFVVTLLAKPESFTTSLSTDIGKLRMLLGDQILGAGVRPSRVNFSDDELQFFLDEEGAHLYRAQAAACEALATIWAPVANLSLGGRSEQRGTIAEQWAKRAKALRESYGSAQSAGIEAGVITLGFAQTFDGSE